MHSAANEHIHKKYGKHLYCYVLFFFKFCYFFFDIVVSSLFFRWYCLLCLFVCCCFVRTVSGHSPRVNVLRSKKPNSPKRDRLALASWTAVVFCFVGLNNVFLTKVALTLLQGKIALKRVLLICPWFS